MQLTHALCLGLTFLLCGALASAHLTLHRRERDLKAARASLGSERENVLTLRTQVQALNGLCERQASALRTAQSDAQNGVRALLPAHCTAPTDTSSAGDLRMAYRAWCSFFNAAPVVFTSWADLTNAQLAVTQVHACLCEYLQRASFETLFALYFDRADIGSDTVVMDSIRETFGATVLHDVHTTVKARGVLVALNSARRSEASSGAAESTAQTAQLASSP